MGYVLNLNTKLEIFLNAARLKESLRLFNNFQGQQGKSGFSGTVGNRGQQVRPKEFLLKNLIHFGALT